MALFGTPDPEPRGQPVLGPLAASVAGFTTGLESGLQSREAKKAALAKQQSQERSSRAKAGASIANKLDSDLGDLTKGDTDRLRALERQASALRKRRGDKLAGLSDEEKRTIGFDLNMIDDEVESLRGSISSITKVGISSRGLRADQKQAVLSNISEIGRPRQFDDFEKFTAWKAGYLARFDPAVAQRLGELIEAERARNTIRIDADILGPGEVILEAEDDDFLEGLFE